jgi:hypothetical protein
MDGTPMFDMFNSEGKAATTVSSGFITVTVPPKTALALQPKVQELGGYSRYKRVN